MWKKLEMEMQRQSKLRKEESLMPEEPRNTMDGRAIRHGSPAGRRTRAIRVEPPTAKRHESGTRVAVVYYLSRNRLLEHPHFMEVPLPSPQTGLYLRDVMNRLDALRGKGIAAMYSWSCKRRYKNGFVWHDLSQDDLLLPSQGTEYVLKGSELLHDQSPLPLQDHEQSSTSNAKVQCLKSTQQKESPRSPRSQREWTSSSLSPPTGSAIPVTKKAVPQAHPQPALSSSTLASTVGEDKQCRTPHACSSGSSSPKTSMPSSGASSPQLNNHVGAHDAATQTDGKVREDNMKLQQGQDAARVSPEGPEIVDESHSKHRPEGEYPCRRSDTLQSLIRAEAASRRVVLEEDGKTTTSSISGKLKPSNLLMRLMACGPNHPGLGFVETSYSKQRTRQLEFPSSPELTPLGTLKPGTITSAVTVRASETEHSSRSLHDSVTGKLKRSSSSHNQDGACEEECSERDSANLSRSRSKRMSDLSSGKMHSSRVVSFRDDKEKAIKIEERLASGARVVIQCAP